MRSSDIKCDQCESNAGPPPNSLIPQSCDIQRLPCAGQKKRHCIFCHIGLYCSTVTYLLSSGEREWLGVHTVSWKFMEGSITVLSRWHVFSLACVLAYSYMFFVCCVVISCWLSRMVFGHVRMVSFYLVSLLPYCPVDFTWGVIRTKLFPCVAYGTP